MKWCEFRILNRLLATRGVFTESYFHRFILAQPFGLVADTERELNKLLALGAVQRRNKLLYFVVTDVVAELLENGGIKDV